MDLKTAVLLILVFLIVACFWFWWVSHNRRSNRKDRDSVGGASCSSGIDWDDVSDCLDFIDGD